MNEKNLHITELLDIYGGLLTDKQLKMASWYYYDDLSLGEIAENEGISRQGARDAIKKAEQKLCEFEQKLHILYDSEKRNRLCDKAQNLCKNIPGDSARTAEEIMNILDELR